MERSTDEISSTLQALEHLVHEDFLSSDDGVNKIKDMVSAVECGLEMITKQMDVVSQFNANLLESAKLTAQASEI